MLLRSARIKLDATFKVVDLSGSEISSSHPPFSCSKFGCGGGSPFSLFLRGSFLPSFQVTVYCSLRFAA